jgi:carbon-monoxide dehydrogenase medium subunit
MGGSVSNNDPAADYPSAVVGLDATLVTSKREIAADDFFTGLFSTALEQDELLIAIRYPKPDTAQYKKFPNPASRYAMVGVFVAKFGDSVRVAVTGAGACVFRVPEMEEKLAKSFTADAIRDVQMHDADLNEDMHATRQYRAHLITTLACRAVAAC